MSAAYHSDEGAARDVLPSNGALPGRGNAPDEIARILDRPPVVQGEAQALIEKAHQVCPYSNATRNNVAVKLSLTEM